MCSDQIAIQVSGLSKCYTVYEKPFDRLKQFAVPYLQRAIGRQPNRYFQEVWALKEISFEVKKGQTVGIVGRNGSGKSTLLQMICGTLTPSEGRVQVNGRVAALLELGSGFNPEFTGRENVYLNAAILGLSKHEIEKRFNQIETFADIGEFIDRPIKTYSSGMQVRLAFAVVANVDADILVIDEALAVGDVFFTQKCMRFLRDFMQNGTVLFVSHDTGAIVNLCSNVIWLDCGRVLANGEPKIVSEDYLAYLYDQNTVKRSSQRVEAKSTTGSTVALQKDLRWDVINASTLQNRLEVFVFDPESADAFGYGAAEIQRVRLLDQQGQSICQLIGGELVELQISILAKQKLEQPIVGFSVKDRLGQVLFGDNTFLAYEDSQPVIQKDGHIKACFRFQMPILPQGDYSVAAAIATGTQINHQQQHWVHDALVIRSVSSSVSTGLVGIPMHMIRLDIE